MQMAIGKLWVGLVGGCVGVCCQPIKQFMYKQPGRAKPCIYEYQMSPWL